MINIKENERLSIMNHSCAHLMAQAIKHLYPNALFWVGPVIEEGFYYDIDLGDNDLKFCPDEIYTSGFNYVYSTYVGKQIRKKGILYFVSSNSNGSARIIFNDFFKGGLSGGFSGGSSGAYDRVFFCDIDAKENEKTKSIPKGTYITVEGKGGITLFRFEHSSENFHLIYPKKIPYLLDCKIINIDEERRYNFEGTCRKVFKLC